MKYDHILERYYRGETTLEEERMLKAAFRRGELPDDPALAFQEQQVSLPASVTQGIQSAIHRKSSRTLRNRLIRAGAIAALLILIISLRGLLPHPQEYLQLSDNMKKERFEGALRMIGKVLEEKAPEQKVLYEDNNLIIAIE